MVSDTSPVAGGCRRSLATIVRTTGMIKRTIFKLILVDLHVRRELVRRAERFVAYLAQSVRTAAGTLYREMLRQLTVMLPAVMVARGRSGNQVAGKACLARVHVSRCERLYCTFVYLHVQVQVHHRHEGLVADVALELLGHTVRILVRYGSTDVLALDDVLRCDWRTSFAARCHCRHGGRGRRYRLLLLLLLLPIAAGGLTPRNKPIIVVRFHMLHQ